MTMAVTEIALLRLKTPEPSSSTREILKQAQQAQSEWSGYPVQFARQLEDSSYFYILGGWESIAHHNGDWIKSETNQKLLAQLKDDVDVEWMFHVDIDVSKYQDFSSIWPMDYSTDTRKPSTSTGPLDAPVIAVSRYFVEHAKKTEFETAFKNGGPYLGAHTAPFAYSGGWRIDKEGDDEEFVLLSGWNKVEDHYGFAKTEGFKVFGKTKGALNGVEVKHLQSEKWE